MKKVLIGMALAMAVNLSVIGIASAAGSIGQGNINIYKGGQLADKLSGQNPIEEGALLVCDGKCMIQSEGISLVAADQAKLAIRNEDKAFNLFLREGNVNYTITKNTRTIAFHTPQGTYTTAEVIFNAGSNPVVRGYAKVNKDGQTEIGVEEGRLIFATAEGMKTVDANHKIVLAISSVPAAGAAAGTGAGAGWAPGGIAALSGVGGGLVAAGFVAADDLDTDSTPTASPAN